MILSGSTLNWSCMASSKGSGNTMGAWIFFSRYLSPFPWRLFIQCLGDGIPVVKQHVFHIKQVADRFDSAKDVRDLIIHQTVEVIYEHDEPGSGVLQPFFLIFPAISITRQ